MTDNGEWEWKQYEDRFASQRPETYRAYVDVWTHSFAARSEFSSWALFSRMASAEPSLRRDAPERVGRAEQIMRDHGYEIGTPTRRGARRWVARASAKAT
jgi:hypothetical protein